MKSLMVPLGGAAGDAFGDALAPRDDGLDLPDRHRRAEQKPLRLGASGGAHEVELSAGLDAFGDGRRALAAPRGALDAFFEATLRDSDLFSEDRLAP